MDGVAKRELTEVEMILGKGMLYDSSGLTELVNMYYLRYGIIIEVVWYPNLWNDSYILSLIKSNSVYEDIIGLLDKVDNYYIYKGLYDRVFDEINKDYITGSILYCLTNHIKEHGWEKTYNEIF